MDITDSTRGPVKFKWSSDMEIFFMAIFIIILGTQKQLYIVDPRLKGHGVTTSLLGHFSSLPNDVFTYKNNLDMKSIYSVPWGWSQFHWNVYCDIPIMAKPTIEMAA